MRVIHRIGAVVVICLLSSATVAYGQYYGNHATFSGRGLDGGYAAPACGSPMYGLVPGCCEFPPSCCTHVWDGYCNQHRGCGFGRRSWGGGGYYGHYAGYGAGWGASDCGCDGSAVEFVDEPAGPAPVPAPIIAE